MICKTDHKIHVLGILKQLSQDETFKYCPPDKIQEYLKDFLRGIYNEEPPEELIPFCRWIANKWGVNLSAVISIFTASPGKLSRPSGGIIQRRLRIVYFHLLKTVLPVFVGKKIDLQIEGKIHQAVFIAFDPAEKEFPIHAFTDTTHQFFNLRNFSHSNITSYENLYNIVGN